MNTKAAAPIVLALFYLLLTSAVPAVATASHANTQRPGRDAAFIFNLGFEDFAGFRIAVDPSGKAWAIDAGGRTSSQLDSDIVNRLFSDLRAAGTLSTIAAQRCDPPEPGIQFPTTVRAPLIVAWRGQATTDLSCATDQRALALRADAAVVQRTLAVQSYRLRSVHFGESDMVNAHSVASDARYARPASTRYKADNSPSSACSCGGTGFDPGHFDAGRFDTGSFNGNAFSSHVFANERFQTEAFNTGSFTMTRLTSEPFSNAAFAHADFHFDTNGFHNTTFNSGFSQGYGSGGFGGGNFGSGGFAGGSFVTYPSP